MTPPANVNGGIKGAGSDRCVALVAVCATKATHAIPTAIRPSPSMPLLTSACGAAHYQTAGKTQKCAYA